MQSNYPKLSNNSRLTTTSKVNSAKKYKGCIKYAPNDEPQSDQLLEYIISLCWPILEYPGALWHPAYAASTHEIEAVQNKAIGFFKKLKERHGITH